jgi:uncharacterized repeat protein (TIGR03803 family)
MLIGVTSAQVSVKFIYSFKNGTGRFPSSGITVDSAGRVYGVTLDGGPIGSFCEGGCGVAFGLAPRSGGGWEYHRLHAFEANTSQDFFPGGNVVVDAAGNVYGVTCFDDLGPGKVYQLSPSPDGNWTETTLHEFGLFGSDDGEPAGGLIMDASGKLYGAMLGGGPAFVGGIYELSPNADGSWTYTVLHYFTSTPDGAGATGELVLDGAGNLYGATAGGGESNLGAVFELSPSVSGNWSEKVLYSFTGGADEARPNGPVVLDAKGNIYGTTGNGDNGPGTVFELLKNPDGTWTETTLHTFANDGVDGTFPASGLSFDRSGNLYGTTQFGGANGQGTVFQMTRLAGGTWSESVIYDFASSGTNNFPSGLTFRNGLFYGTTKNGGAFGEGAVFVLKP